MNLVARCLADDGVIAYPTEGVWGLGCLPNAESAVLRILEMKRRSPDQGLILVAGDIRLMDPYLGALTAEERAQLERTWPGPVTYLVPDCGQAPDWIRGRHTSVALRVSRHPVIRKICAEVGSPIVSTSANPSGRPPARSALKLRQYFPGGIDYVVPGDLGGATGPSEIVDLRSGQVVRPGTGSA